MGLDMYLNRIDRKVNTVEEVNKILDTHKRTPSERQIKAYELLLEDKPLEAVGVIEPWNKVEIDKFTCEEDTGMLRYEGKGISLPEYMDRVCKVIEKMHQNMVPEVAEYLNTEDKDIYVKNEEIAYWRKHPDLHGYMEELYRERGGDKVFNCEKVILSKEDIEELISLIGRQVNGEDIFEEVTGFFFGETQIEDWVDDLNTFAKVLKETDWENETVYYSSWW